MDNADVQVTRSASRTRGCTVCPRRIQQTRHGQAVIHGPIIRQHEPMSVNEHPHILYKYEPFTLRAIQNLKRQSLYFGSPSGFNDPFDCALTPRFKPPTDIETNAVAAKFIADPATPPQMRELLQSLPMPQLKEQLLASAKNLVQQQCDDFNKTNGISCFSEINDNLLMWSHYGGQHRSFCLEFNTRYELGCFMFCGQSNSLNRHNGYWDSNSTGVR